MGRHYNIGTECYALLMSGSDPEFMLPVRVVLLAKFAKRIKTYYKVKIKEILEPDFDYIKEHISSIKVTQSFKDDALSIVTKNVVEKMEVVQELVVYLSNKSFLVEDNYITLDRMSLKDLYHRFTKYIINYHFRKLYQLMNRRFIYDSPIYASDKDLFLKRVERMGFGELFKDYELKLDI